MLFLNTLLCDTLNDLEAPSHHILNTHFTGAFEGCMVSRISKIQLSVSLLPLLGEF